MEGVLSHNYLLSLNKLLLKRDMVEIKVAMVETKEDMVEIKVAMVETKEDTVETKEDTVEIKVAMVETKEATVEIKEAMEEISLDTEVVSQTKDGATKAETKEAMEVIADGDGLSYNVSSSIINEKKLK